jgi:hypothetical protein
MSLYKTTEGVEAFHQKPYPKRRPTRSADFRQPRLFATIPGSATLENESNPTYQEFVEGSFELNTALLDRALSPTA